MTFEDLTEEQKASLKGDKGDKGDTGATGRRGAVILTISTAPTSCSVEINGITAKYYIYLSTIASETG